MSPKGTVSYYDGIRQKLSNDILAMHISDIGGNILAEESTHPDLDKAFRSIDEEAKKRYDLIDSFRENPLDIWKPLSVLESLTTDLAFMSMLLMITLQSFTDFTKNKENRDNNMELLNAMMTKLYEKTENYDEAIEKMKTFFKDLESQR